MILMRQQSDHDADAVLFCLLCVYIINRLDHQLSPSKTDIQQQDKTTRQLALING